jgi:hypothetical protein
MVKSNKFFIKFGNNFTESHISADFIVNALEQLWPILKETYDPTYLACLGSKFR